MKQNKAVPPFSYLEDIGIPPCETGVRHTGHV